MPHLKTAKSIAALMLAGLLSLAAANAGASANSRHGWTSGSLDDAIKSANGTRPILLQVFAHWCTPCNALNNEVLNTDDGARLLKTAVGLRVDFNTKRGQKLTRKYAVINLPTTLVLTAKGEEIGRVEGYPGRREYLNAIKDALAGRAGVDALKKLLDRKPGDPGLMTNYAQALLVRGKINLARPLFEKLMKRTDDHGARATRIWGRWLLRVKKRYVEATNHFLAAMKRFKKHRARHGFLYWAAKGYQARKLKSSAIALFDAWLKKEPGSLKAYLYKADFMVHFKYQARTTEALVVEALKLAPKEAWLHYLQAKLRFRQKDTEGAKRSIRQALALKPSKAIFQNFMKKLAKKT